jgi:hypothetical protein
MLPMGPSERRAIMISAAIVDNAGEGTVQLSTESCGVDPMRT